MVAIQPLQQLVGQVVKKIKERGVEFDLVERKRDGDKGGCLVDRWFCCPDFPTPVSDK